MLMLALIAYRSLAAWGLWEQRGDCGEVEMFGMEIFAGPPNSGEAELYMLYCVTI
jgi:hypothetical protein